MNSENSEIQRNKFVSDEGYCLVIEYNDKGIKASAYNKGICTYNWSDARLGTDCIVQDVYYKVLMENKDMLQDGCAFLYKNGYGHLDIENLIRSIIYQKCEHAVDFCYSDNSDMLSVDIKPICSLLGIRNEETIKFRIDYYGSLDDITAGYREQVKAEMEALHEKVSKINCYHCLDRVVLAGKDWPWMRSLIRKVFCKQEYTHLCIDTD